MTSATTLSFSLAGVLSWARPREQPTRGGGRRTAYPPAYAAGRDGWALLARAAVLEAGWAPPLGSRFSVDVLVYGGGKRDIDRICTAVLDALQAGQAIADDCYVDGLHAIRYPLRYPHGRGVVARQPTTIVRVVVLDPPEKGKKP